MERPLIRLFGHRFNVAQRAVGLLVLLPADVMERAMLRGQDLTAGGFGAFGPSQPHGRHG